MNYEKRCQELVEAIKQLQETNPSDEGIQNWVNDTLYGTEETDDERIRKALLEYFGEECDTATINGIYCYKIYDWLKKQGEQKPKKVSIWKHWKDGIAGNGEGEQTFLIKSGLTYSISSCLGQECDYIELSELDELLREEKQGKSKWSEEDDCYMSECISAIATKDGWSFEEKRETKRWLQSLKQRIVQ